MTRTNPTTDQTTPAAPVVPGDLIARHQTITGLRALADFLEANPAVPVKEYGALYSVHTRVGDDTAAAALVDQVAALLDSEVTDDRPRGGHYIAAKTFGRITYQMVHIPARQMDEHHAQLSYRTNIRLNPDHNDQSSSEDAGRAA